MEFVGEEVALPVRVKPSGVVDDEPDAVLLVVPEPSVLLWLRVWLAGVGDSVGPVGVLLPTPVKTSNPSSVVVDAADIGTVLKQAKSKS